MKLTSTNLAIILAVIIITIAIVSLINSPTDKTEFKIALINDGKATYQCDKYGEVTFVIVDTEMASTRDLFKEE